MKKKLLLMIVAVTSVFAVAKAEDYGIKVSGVSITSENYADPLGNGTVKYVPGQFLCLRNAVLTDLIIDNDMVVLLQEGGAVVNGTVRINADDVTIMAYSYDNELTINGIEDASVGLSIANKLYVEYATVNINAPIGVSGQYIEGDCTLKLTSANCNIFSDNVAWKNVIPQLDGTQLVEPEGAVYSVCKLSEVAGADQRAYNVGGTPCKELHFKHDGDDDYYIFIYISDDERIDITSENCADPLGDGSVNYNSATHTLTLDNANIQGIYTGNDITIEVVGDNSIGNIDGLSIEYTGFDNITITGDGMLACTGKISTYNSLIIKDTKLDVVADAFALFGVPTIPGFEHSLIIDNSDVSITLQGESRWAAIVGFQEFNLINAEIVTPEGTTRYEDSEAVGLRALLDADGNAIIDQVVIKAKSEGVSDITSADAAEIIGIYGIDGRQRSAMAKGINVVRYSDGTARKMLVK
ncbi:MAG: hypothetical protein ACI306_07530 [Muribaculaceae bacterium]